MWTRCPSRHPALSISSFLFTFHLLTPGSSCTTMNRLWNVSDWTVLRRIKAWMTAPLDPMLTKSLLKPLRNVTHAKILTGCMCNCFSFSFAPPLSAQHVKIKREKWCRSLRLGGIVMSNCHIVCLIWSRKAAIVMKHQWRRARKGEDYTAWAIHGTIHPFIALGFPHSHCPGSIVGHVRAGCGLEEDGRSAEVTTLISDASLHFIVHCASTWQPYCEDCSAE